MTIVRGRTRSTSAIRAQGRERDWALASYIEGGPGGSWLFDNCDDRLNNTVDIGWMELAAVKRGKQALESVH